MNNEPQKAMPASHDEEHAAKIAHLDRVAVALDSRFAIPGTGIRFGWDSIVGLIPGLGDLATLGPAAYLLYHGYRSGARKRALARMAANSAADFVIGGVPVIGDLFDVAFKANLRNVAIIRSELEQKRNRARPVSEPETALSDRR